MPACADPNETIPLSLETDKALPDATRPAFDIRFLTESEIRQVARLITEAGAAADDDAAKLKLRDCIAIGLTGWRNMIFRGDPIPYAADKWVGDFLTLGEVWELAYLVLRGTRLGEEDRKKSLSLSTSAADSSAPNAEPKAAA